MRVVHSHGVFVDGTNHFLLVCITTTNTFALSTSRARAAPSPLLLLSPFYGGKAGS